MNSKNTRLESKLIFAMDVPPQIFGGMIDQLTTEVEIFKVGLTSFCKPCERNILNPFFVRNKEVFVDLKMYDIPETVRQAVKSLNDQGVKYTTVHACPDVIDAAVFESGGPDGLEILVVTGLTSLEATKLRLMGINTDSFDNWAIQNAMMAKRRGAHGVIAPGHLVQTIKATCGNDFKVVVPGIREFDQFDDQVHVSTPKKAIQAGADHIVVGRPIRMARNMADVARRINLQIEEALCEIVGVDS